MQLLQEGVNSSFSRLTYRVEYETKREGTKVACRFAITYAIRNGSWYGFNQKARVKANGEELYYTLKNSYPNTGSGSITTNWIEFENGYTNNAIPNVNIYIYSDNGGGGSWTSNTVTLYAPTGYVPSAISNDVNFSTEEQKSINITDITNLNYNYTLNIYVENTLVATRTFTEKTYIIQFANSETENIYEILKNSNTGTTKMELTTKYGDTIIGTTVKTGTCYVVNCNPGFETEGITFVNTSSYMTLFYSVLGNSCMTNVPSRGNIKVSSVIFKGHAIFKEAILFINNYEIKGTYDATEEKYVFNFENIVFKNTTEAECRIYDSRGNYCSQKLTIFVIDYSIPQVNDFKVERQNNYDETVDVSIDISVNKLYELFNGQERLCNDLMLVKLYIYKEEEKVLETTIFQAEYVNNANGVTYVTTDNFVWNDTEDKATYETSIAGFDKNAQYRCELIYNDVVTSICSLLGEGVNYISETKVNVGIPLVCIRKKGVAINSVYDEQEGGLFQVNGKDVTTKNIITFAKNNNQTLTAYNTATIQLNTIIAREGNKLTTSGNGILIGQGVSKILVSGVAWLKTEGYKTLKICKDDEQVAYTIIQNSEDWASPVVPPCLTDVEEGDLITLRAEVSVDGECLAGTYGTASTYLTVEVVS